MNERLESLRARLGEHGQRGAHAGWPTSAASSAGTPEGLTPNPNPNANANPNPNPNPNPHPNQADAFEEAMHPHRQQQQGQQAVGGDGVINAYSTQYHRQPVHSVYEQPQSWLLRLMAYP